MHCDPPMCLLYIVFGNWANDRWLGRCSGGSDAYPITSTAPASFIPSIRSFGLPAAPRPVDSRQWSVVSPERCCW